MAIVKVGTFTVTASGTAQNLVLGFKPDHFVMTNISNVVAPEDNALWKAEWFAGMANGTGIGYNYTASQPAIEVNNISADGFTPLQSTDANLFTPQQVPYTTTTGDNQYIGASTLLVIEKASGISQAAEASVTATHSFTTDDIGVTVVTFSGVPGMTQINGLRGTITSVTSTTSFTVDIDSTNFSAYDSTGVTDGLNSGFANVITGAPVNTLYGNKLLPTAQANLGVIGLTLGSNLMIDQGDVWRYVATLDAPIQ